jgi:catechol 2,3-dioxygenase-like lactoylglutathione lyase family enzyme
MRKASTITAVLLTLAIGIAGLAVNQSASRSTQDSHQRPAASGTAAAPSGMKDVLSLKPSATAIVTQDLDRTVTWYRDTLGFREIPRRSDAERRIVFLERAGTLLELREGDQKILSAGEDQSATSRLVSVEVWVEDVDPEVGRLQERGIEPLTRPRDRPDGKFRGVLIHDIDGRLIGLREPLTSR